ncbi:MAG: hypothetical protein K9W43_11510 [Candidatus Thorarchaeota archaeon]|nr:hypothetical protein [Candidatus Thorarchaeota archaeon]
MILRKGTLVKVKLHEVVFPNICPVCGRPATHPFTVSTKSKAPPARVTLWGIEKPSYPSVEPLRIKLSVCDDHWHEMRRYEDVSAINVVVGFLAITAGLLIATHIAFRLYDRLPLDIFTIQVFIAVIVLIAAVMYLLGPTSLGQSIRIVDGNLGTGVALLAIRSHDYVEILVRQNPSSVVKIIR